MASLFAKAKVRLLRREAATEEAFRLEPLSEFDVVHFATHGLVRQELPGLREPSLVFTPDPKGDAFNDGLLTASQIAALPLGRAWSSCRRAIPRATSRRSSTAASRVWRRRLPSRACPR